MPDKFTRALLVVLVLLVGYLAFSVHELEEQVDRLPRSFTTDHSAVNAVNAFNPPLLQIQKNQVSMAAGLHYLELLLEGVVRNDKLPIESARKAFGERADGVPPGWNWNAPWETAPPAPGK